MNTANVDNAEPYAPLTRRIWSVFWRTLLRTIVALGATQLCMVSSFMLWNTVSYFLIPYVFTNQLTQDTMALAAPLAASSVGFIVLIVSLVPFLVAAWSVRHSIPRRFLAALAGLAGGLLATLAGQMLISVLSGYGFTLRHAPMTLFDWGSLVLGSAFGLWSSLRIVPYSFPRKF